MSGQVGHATSTSASSARYGLLGLPLAFVALPVYVHLPNHYAQHHAMPLAALGGVLLFSRAADALIDPWLGRVGDALYRRAWRAVGWAAVLLALGIAAGFVALFFPPALSPSDLLLWVAAALTLSHVSYSGLTILHQAWAARQGGGVRAQSRWVAWREGWGLVGVLLASALPTLLGWTATTGVLVLALLAGLWAWQQAQNQTQDQNRNTKGVDAPAPTLDAVAAPESSAFWRPWLTPGFARLLGVFVVNGLASALPATLVLFFVQDGVQAPQAMQPLFLGVYFAAGALSFPLWLRVIDRVGLLRSWWAGMALSVLAFAGVLALGPGDAHAFLGICLASGLALGADLTVPGALHNQLIDRSGERGRTDGAFMGWWNLATKLNLALAAGLALPLLALGGYAPGQREPGALLTLSLAYGLLPCLLKLLAMGGLYVGLMRRTDARSNAASHATTPH